jgi:hypothetical protein
MRREEGKKEKEQGRGRRWEGGREGGRNLGEGDVGEGLGGWMDDIEVLHDGGTVVGDGHGFAIVPEGGRKGGREGGRAVDEETDKNAAVPMQGGTVHTIFFLFFWVHRYFICMHVNMYIYKYISAPNRNKCTSLSPQSTRGLGTETGDARAPRQGGTMQDTDPPSHTQCLRT